MSYVESIRNQTETWESLSHQFYDDILKNVVRHKNALAKEAKEAGKMNISVWKSTTPADFEQVKQELGKMDNTTFDEFVQMVKLVEEYEALYYHPNVGRFSEDPAGKEGANKVEKIREITNKALIRELAREMVSDKVTLIEKTDNPYQDVEESNDRIYDALEHLGLGKETVSGVPRVVSGNLQLYLKKQEVKEKLKTTVAMANRLEFYLSQYDKSKSYATDPASVRRILGEEKIQNIRKSLGKKESIEREIAGEKQKKLEQFFKTHSDEKIQRGSNTMLGKLDTQIQSMMSGKNPVTYRDYDYLFQLEFDQYQYATGNEILRSGAKQYVDIRLWGELLAQYKEKANELYREAMQIPEAQQFLEQKLGERKERDMNQELIFDLWNHQLTRKERKGEDVSAERARYLKNLQTYRKATSPDMPIKPPHERG